MLKLALGVRVEGSGIPGKREGLMQHTWSEPSVQLSEKKPFLFPEKIFSSLNLTWTPKVCRIIAVYGFWAIMFTYLLGGFRYKQALNPKP